MMTKTKRPVRVVLIAKVYLNPYARQLAAGINQAAPKLRAEVRDGFSFPWMVRQTGRIAILHFHWVEMLYDAPVRWRRYLRLASLLSGLYWAKLTGVKIVYTVHNLTNHEGMSPRLNRIANKVMFRLADTVHVHNEHARADVARCCRRTRNVFVIPHGSYIGTYPDDISREEARCQFGLAQDQFVFLFLGLLRPYKGIERLLDAFSRLEAPQARLILAGHVASPEYKALVLTAAKRDARLQVFPQYVPDAEIARFLRAADCSVHPYQHATTSGAALLAFSFGLPIIAPAMGPFPALANHQRGLLYDPERENGLLEALQAALNGAMAGMGANALVYAGQRSWDRIGRQHAAMYSMMLHRPLTPTEGDSDDA